MPNQAPWQAIAGRKRAAAERLEAKAVVFRRQAAELDYAAELRRIREEQGLPDELPDELRDAVAALLTPTTSDEVASDGARTA